MSSSEGNHFVPTFAMLPPVSRWRATSSKSNNDSNTSGEARQTKTNDTYNGHGATQKKSHQEEGPKSKMSSMNLPRVNMPQMNMPQMNMPQVNMPQMNMGGISSMNMNITGATSRASNTIGSVISSLSNLTARKYTLPDRTTASQVLMFRQLLHTSCKPGLRLSRKYQGTTAQKTVMHMPWWEKGVEQSGRMLISYDNLITRLWMSGAILPYAPGGIALSPDLDEDDEEDDFLSLDSPGTPSSKKTETFCNEKGLPPIPHPWWVNRLGFQQEDPVTDFRSGGVLSLAMLLHITESCPHVHRRFLDQGDCSVLPFGITSINVTDMLAKFLMFSKSVDRIDALLSSKPFWRMFADPNALLVLQELSMNMLCDVTCELRSEYADKGEGKDVTVFDFHVIMERTEKRVENDLLGAGPTTVEELRIIYNKIREKKIAEMERKEMIAQRKLEKAHSLNFSFFKGKKSRYTTELPPTQQHQQQKQEMSLPQVQLGEEETGDMNGNFVIDDDEWLSDKKDFEQPRDIFD